MSNKKGQAWGFDLMIGTMIFLTGVVFFYLYSINYAGGDELALTSLKEESGLVADSLMSSGFPSDWNTENVIRIGIVDDGKINQSKLDNFYFLISNDYLKAKALFKVKNEIYVNFSSSVVVNGTVLNVIGNLPAEEQDNLVKTNRAVVYDNKIITMEVFSWN